MNSIATENYRYNLPEELIAKYPLAGRDQSRLLLCKSGTIEEDSFRNLANHLESNDMLMFNDSKVVRARLIMRKETGALIEILCLEPYYPISFEKNFASVKPVRWRCLIGNLRRWKSGRLATTIEEGGRTVRLEADKMEREGDEWIVEFSWDDKTLSFSEILERAGKVPIPPYLNRDDEPLDADRYQTVYCKSEGSVAAPTAGLHFTPAVIESLARKGLLSDTITLHVGAGTFRPIKSPEVRDHEMHTEHFFVSAENIKSLLTGRVIAVGTTTMRAVESIYWAGVSIIEGRMNHISGPSVGQWEPYRHNRVIDKERALEAVGEYIETTNSGVMSAKTSLMIVPGYRFRVAEGLITNFHLPGSTLMLLVAALAGERWRDIYDYAIERRFRFLSYGDSSLIIP